MKWGDSLEDRGIRPKAVSFDVGGTLIVPSPSVGVVYARVAARLGLGEFDPGQLDLGFRSTFQARILVGYTLDEWREVVRRTFEPVTPHADDPTLFEALWNEFLKPEVWRVFDEVVPVLEHLRLSGVRLAVTSNWDCRLATTLKNLDLEQYFEVILASTEVGSPKPDAAVFNETARRLRLEPSEILHVGDSRREDFEGAKTAGYQVVLLDRRSGPNSEIRSDLTFLKGWFTALP